jgi:hypothetical protein
LRHHVSLDLRKGRLVDSPLLEIHLGFEQPLVQMFGIIQLLIDDLRHLVEGELDAVD